uniref:Uncharacterized protein n=1 Tax=Cannabis sativa TaxID=3483 RepID=A0A803P682_CANSA
MLPRCFCLPPIPPQGPFWIIASLGFPLLSLFLESLAWQVQPPWTTLPPPNALSADNPERIFTTLSLAQILDKMKPHDSDPNLKDLSSGFEQASDRFRRQDQVSWAAYSTAISHKQKEPSSSSRKQLNHCQGSRFRSNRFWKFSRGGVYHLLSRTPPRGSPPQDVSEYSCQGHNSGFIIQAPTSPYLSNLSRQCLEASGIPPPRDHLNHGLGRRSTSAGRLGVSQPTILPLCALTP